MRDGHDERPVPAPLRLRRGLGVAAVLGVVALVALVGCGPATDPGATSAGPSSGTSGGATTGPATTGSAPPDEPVPTPDADVVALADAAHLSEAGREIFYRTEPELLDAAGFAGRCAGEHRAGAEDAEGAEDGTAVGCYLPGDDAIVLYRPADERLFPWLVETAAHELLHAAWTRLDAAERTALEAPLEAAVAGLPADAAVLGQIAGSVGDEPASRPTELFAYLGTQQPVGTLTDDLEAVYARFVADRAGLVGQHTAWQAVLDGARADAQAAVDAAQAAENARAVAVGDAETLRAAVTTYRASLEEEQAAADAQPEVTARSTATWTWWDGTALGPAPTAEVLAAAADLLARDEAALAERDAAVAAATAEADRLRVSSEQRIADHDALRAQLDPTGGAGGAG